MRGSRLSQIQSHIYKYKYINKYIYKYINIFLYIFRCSQLQGCSLLDSVSKLSDELGIYLNKCNYNKLYVNSVLVVITDVASQLIWHKHLLHVDLVITTDS